MADTQDDGFHEIQLNGKQLVFLFMAATVVSVVIFLCGVLVGRGVRAERGTVALSTALNETPAPDAVPAEPPTTVASVQAGADPRAAAPPTPVDDLSYFNRLEKTNQAAEDLTPTSSTPSKPEPPPTAVKKTPPTAAKPVSRNPVPPRASPQAAVAAPAPEPTVASPAPAATPPSVGDGYAVQVAAVNVRSDADAIVKRLSSKGYTAYVAVPPNGTGTVFRVRIGTFTTRREAETVAAKLQKEEQIKPWVTR
jgi:cell division septation protein DedD